MRWSPRTLVALTAVCGLTAISFLAAAPADASSVPAFCAGTADINAGLVTTSIKLKDCAIQGRRVVLARHDGGAGPAVSVPPEGQGVGDAVLTTAGEYELAVTNTAGVVSVKTSAPGGAPVMAPAVDAACGQSAYNLEGAHWTSTLRWYYNQSTVSRAGLGVSATLSDVRAGNYNLTTGQNNCGYATGAFNVAGSYQGNTSLFANIDSSAACTSRFPDGQNTVSWGPFNSSAAGTLAVTCYHWNGSTMTEADTYLGSNVGMVDTFPSSCSGKYDLQSISTHEWGHAFGLAHETSGPDEVMYPYKSACALRRHLGKGDYAGMNAMY
jgi:hypothetical protein